MPPAAQREDADEGWQSRGSLSRTSAPRLRLTVAPILLDAVALAEWRNMRAEHLLSRVARALLPVSAVRAALLYGSQVTAHVREDSDIDVAVLLESAPLPCERKQVLWALLAALGKELRSDRIDLVLLNDAPPKLAFHVLKYGRSAFIRDPVAFHRFQVRTFSRHADYEPVERLFRLATKRRAQSAGTVA
jgi:uncharacterized protein